MYPETADRAYHGEVKLWGKNNPSSMIPVWLMDIMEVRNDPLELDIVLRTVLRRLDLQNPNSFDPEVLELRSSLLNIRQRYIVQGN